jgi:phosphomevalonate kinase
MLSGQSIIFLFVVYCSDPSQASNSYIEITLMYTMCFAMSHGKAKQWQHQLQHFDLQLVLQADNDFYSQTAQLEARGLPVTAESLATLPAFLPCPEGEI